jgi:hypothetical protein
MISLDELQTLWKEDSKINIDDLHNESIKIPLLHSKYYEFYNKILLLRKKCELDYKAKKLDKYNYYSGKADPEVYKQNPFPYKVRDKESLQRYLDADQDLYSLHLKLDYYQTLLNFIEEIIKQLSNRTYQIKNSIDFLRFQSGM